MKKIFLIMFALICFSATAKAQVCKISGSNDSVEVFSNYIDIENNQVVVTVGNDSNDISANVTIQAEVFVIVGSSYTWKTYTGKAIAKPNQTTSVIIKPDGKLGEKSSVRNIKISGTKCQ